MQRPCFDLRHLIALQVLLEERHVSRAAVRLGLTQPAVSNSLAHLRAHFKDEFLVKQGNKLVLTPFAEKIQVSVNELLAGLQNIARARPNFVPGAIEQTFQIVVSDSALHLLPGLVRRIGEIAPRATVSYTHPSRDAHERHKAGEIDLLILPQEIFLDDHPREAIISDQWVCLVSEDNHLVGDSLSLETYRRLRHVLPEIGRPGATELLCPEIDRIAGVYAPLSLAPSFLPGTCLIATVPLRLARTCRDVLGLRQFPVPFAMPPQVLAMEWHPQKHRDPANIWLRSVVRDVCAEQARNIALWPRHEELPSMVHRSGAGINRPDGGYIQN